MGRKNVFLIFQNGEVPHIFQNKEKNRLTLITNAGYRECPQTELHNTVHGDGVQIIFLHFLGTH